MKLTESYFFPVVTEAGAVELYHFAESVLHKYYNQIPKQQHEDVIQAMVLRCLEHLPKFDHTRKVPLGGYLFNQCRGAATIHINHTYRELAFPTDKLTLLHSYRKKQKLHCL